MKTNRFAADASWCLLLVLIALLTVMAVDGRAATTLSSPDFRKPVLTPESQTTNAWTNVIPNALAGYFTYVPYRTSDAVKLGFPSSCGRLPDDPASTEDCYTITVRKFQQALALPGIFLGGQGLLDGSGAPFGPITWVQGYGSGGQNWTPPGAPAGVTVTGNAPAPFVDNTFATAGIWHFPAPTIKGTKGRPVRITWLNELPNEKPTGFDPTICDNMPMDCYPYNRIVTHAHGAHVTPESDGYANAWYTPGFAVKGEGWESTAQYGPEGTYRYPMDQEAATLWYHDHAMGLTHNNTNMGMAGFFPVTDNDEKCLQGIGSGCTKYLPTGDYELGFAMQDRIFYDDGQLAMNDTPIIDARDIVDPLNLQNPFNCTYTYQNDGTITPNDLSKCVFTPLFMKDPADGHLIPYVAAPGVQPLLATSSTLEFFGNLPVVNGVVNGKYEVEPRVYRMRFIGGTDSRTWIMQLVNSTTSSIIPFWQIATEQGFLNKPVRRDSMALMGGERLDVLVDFGGIAPGTRVIMKNLGPDDPFDGSGTQTPSLLIPQIMVFDVVNFANNPQTGQPYPDVPSPNADLVLHTVAPLTPTPGVAVRKVSLWEIVDQYGRTMPTIDGRGFGGGITELISLNNTEQWDIINTTVDAHPMHLHQVAFQLINREPIEVLGIDPISGDPILRVTYAGVLPGPLTPPDYVGTGVIEPPGAFEAGFKDTILCPPGKVTRVVAKFDIPGLYVWHCHILSHEEHDMMRPFVVTTAADHVNLAASTATNSQLSGSVVPVTLMASTVTTLAAFPNGSGFEYRFSVTPPQGVTVTQPVPAPSMFASSSSAFSIMKEAVWTPPGVPGTYLLSVNSKPIGTPAAAPDMVTATLNYVIVAPAVSAVTSATPSAAFKAGGTVDVTVRFNQPVTSTSGLSLTLNSGATVTTAPLTNTDTVTASYLVASGDNSPAGQFLNVTAITSTGTVVDQAGNPAQLAIPSGFNLADSARITIDTVTPVTTISPVPGTYAAAVVNVTLSSEPGATIYYTLDGSDPTTSATKIAYSAAIVIAANTTVRYSAVDQAGNVEAAKSAAYVIHVADLTASVKINNGAAFTRTAAVNLVLSAVDPAGVAKMQFSTDGSAYTAEEPYATARTLTLPGGDGVKTVYVKFRDAALGGGVLYGPFTAQITLDTTAPVTTVTPATGITSLVPISVSLQANDGTGSGIAAIRYTRDGSDPTVSATAADYSAPIAIGADTTLTLKYFATDAAGNREAVQSATFAVTHPLDMTATVLINNGAPVSLTAAITLNLTATDTAGVAAMQFSNDGSNFTPLEPYAATRAWSLLPGAGLKTVFVKFTDGVGNIYGPFTAQITLASKDGLLPGATSLLSSAYKALQIAKGLSVPTPLDLAHGDVAPYISGTPQPDGKIDLLDAYVILRSGVGLMPL
jgi:FtsP/CotA-like multicopper oxidase with cupredoxin domain